MDAEQKLYSILPTFDNLTSQNNKYRYIFIFLYVKNLNSITAEGFIEIALLQAYITQYNYDIICLSETLLNSSIQSDDEILTIDGYNLIRSDHPFVFIIRSIIPTVKRDDICKATLMKSHFGMGVLL